jgi:hypothetical protein
MRSRAEALSNPLPQGQPANLPQAIGSSLWRSDRAMERLTPFRRMELGLRAASRYLSRQDKIWARHSNDKVDVGDTLTTTLRTLNKALPLESPLTARRSAQARNRSCGSFNRPARAGCISSIRGDSFAAGAGANRSAAHPARGSHPG